MSERLAGLIVPRALCVGFVLAFAACSAAGWLASSRNPYQHFVRFHQFLSAESLYHPTVSQLRALVTAVTDDAPALLEAADVGAWVVCRRVKKPREIARGEESRDLGAPLLGVIALYPMVRHPALSHSEADRYWRDRHAPLALRHHIGMSHYTQLSIVHRLHGPEWDGFALCGFDSMDELRERFFDGPEGRVAIREDVARFADGSRSPRRLIAVEESYG